MCLSIKGRGKNPPEPKVAEEDIPVWKTIGKDGKGWLHSLRINGIKEPWTRGFHYIELTPFASIHKSAWYNNTWNIAGDAFHSRISKEKALEPESTEHIVQMIVPKGALYYINEEEGDIASSEIIFPYK